VTAPYRTPSPPATPPRPPWWRRALVLADIALLAVWFVLLRWPLALCVLVCTPRWFVPIMHADWVEWRRGTASGGPR
jgi:hypothetical protein